MFRKIYNKLKNIVDPNEVETIAISGIVVTVFTSPFLGPFIGTFIVDQKNKFFSKN
ncbi:hypothetical protein Catovirus_1_580 [Catovirus CTV1]|uniref:Uncharacterized protein n=1 Tax=Catovirus CTV1 TaxID=1977631 RepID=A0A1V0S9Z1_9VIRU|nr:hypothetical protein Catovirus_1_580 [Catovirus CTV1]